ncbi:MAG: hypothetical protein LBV74_05170 [Tannerella sp.]|nr:hypothetical protein [Tannerella sp.]
MTDEELKIYVKDKRKFFTSPETFLDIETKVNELLNVSEFTFEEKIYTRWVFEFLCFTIHTSRGCELYLKLLNHVTRYCPDIALKYWDIFDDQENMKERYRI